MDHVQLSQLDKTRRELAEVRKQLAAATKRADDLERELRNLKSKKRSTTNRSLQKRINEAIRVLGGTPDADKGWENYEEPGW